jgi:pseudouridine-5'-phosphate glycosidase
VQLTFAPEVAAARAARQPIVALESTLVAHGLPWPDNLAVARELEATVRAHGSTPATIAILDGQPCIGLDPDALEHLARDAHQFSKAGATDLAVHFARHSSAATTVSATALLAARAGIHAFATGGIGGVHRGDTGDVSHDLVALASTPIAVISAGAKAILDLPRTLEQLETLGALVIGYRTHQFPAFYTPSSGIALDHRADTPAELAAIAHARWTDLAAGGILICNPIPDADALEASTIERAIATALADAAAARITGKQLTPFLLARLAQVTAGASIRANRALAIHNAQVASQFAVALAAHRAPLERTR